jgi:uncharacterized protein YprB with RNaseH-like and TPR domain
MKTITKNININNSICIDNNLFFDIETTGFSRTTCFCYLIGAAYRNNDSDTITIIQWLAESDTDEPALLSEFAKLTASFSSLTHFNGDSFDIPFLQKRTAIHNIELHLDNLRSIDLYKHAKGLKSLLRLESYNQKSVEHFLGIHREDKYSGGELIKVYKDYVKNVHTPIEHNEAERLLLLHNFDDICGLLKVSGILSYNNIINKRFTYKDMMYTICQSQDLLHSADSNWHNAATTATNNSTTTNNSNNNNINNNHAYITLSFSLPDEVPVSVLLKDDEYVLRAEKDVLKLRFPVLTDTLKFFYADYRNYYYLPYEDTAMHKSVAAYVDAECKVKATKETCYTKKYAAFIMLPAYSGDMPVFKRDYNEQNVYLMLDSSAEGKTISDYNTESIKNMLPLELIHEAAYSIITFFYKRTARYTHNQDPYS